MHTVQLQAKTLDCSLIFANICEEQRVQEGSGKGSLINIIVDNSGTYILSYIRDRWHRHLTIISVLLYCRIVALPHYLAFYVSHFIFRISYFVFRFRISNFGSRVLDFAFRMLHIIVQGSIATSLEKTAKPSSTRQRISSYI